MEKLAIRTVEDVSNNQKKGVYNDGFLKPRIILTKDTVVHDDKSDKWNQNKVAEINKKVLEHNEFLKYGTLVGTGDFKTDLIAAIQSEYKISEVQAEMTFDLAYSEEEESTNFEIIDFAKDYAEFAQKIVNA